MAVMAISEGHFEPQALPGLLTSPKKLLPYMVIFHILKQTFGFFWVFSAADCVRDVALLAALNLFSWQTPLA